MNKVDKAKNIEDKRWATLLEATVGFKEECFGCGYFNKDVTKQYKCALTGRCPGVTLDSAVNKRIVRLVKNYIPED